MTTPEDAPWYQDGLAFECTRCGACCTGAPGYVWVNDAEIADLARHRNMAVPAFLRAFVRQVGGRLSLIERPGGDCIFWERGTGCTVYASRPVQCRTWPFWPENIESPEAWEHVTEVCPGSGRGPIFSVEEIRASAARVHTS
ncbi:YkgJ family cysteine cluster protein [Tundrisphaera sp. TA3]|uniref:YkgJ family cysteine cluster protein n=1 Tax=Tundrisphaera sp. TA3 TaxID=3435775 RepID=UPI003EBE34F3